MLRDAGVTDGYRIMADSTVLPGNIAYPTDIWLTIDSSSERCNSSQKRYYAD
jgi:hypothetical protein